MNYIYLVEWSQTHRCGLYALVIFAAVHFKSLIRSVLAPRQLGYGTPQGTAHIYVP